MLVVADMVFAVAVVAIAAGAIAEFQLRMGNVRPAAEGAAVVIGGLGSGHRGLIRPGRGEGNDRGALGLGGGLLRLFLKQPSCVDPPAYREYVHHIFAEEQEIVQQCHQGEQPVGEGGDDKGALNHIIKGNAQIKQGKNPSPHRDDEQKQKLGAGVQGGIGDKQTQVQIAAHVGIKFRRHIIGDTLKGKGHAAEGHGKGVHQQNAGEIEQVKPEGSPSVFHGFAQGIVAHQTDEHKQNIAIPEYAGADAGDQPPDLTLQNQVPVKAQNAVQSIGTIDHAHDIYHSIGNGNVQH